MSKITLDNVGNLIDVTTAQTAINDNFDIIEVAFDNTLSRDGTSPNTMGSNLDMNSFQILNLPVPMTANSPVRLQDIEDLTNTGTLSLLPSGGTTGQVLTKVNNTDYNVQWSTTVNSVVMPSDFTVNTANSIATVDWASAPTGTGKVVRQTSPTLVTPNLGTPSTIILTNATGLPFNTGITGLAPGVGTFFTTPSSANFGAMLTDETGSGNVVFNTMPTFVGNITAPVIIGGSGTTGVQLTLQTTTGVGTTDAFQFQGGNNGATDFGRWNSTGLSIGAGSAPNDTLQLYKTNAGAITHGLRTSSNNTASGETHTTRFSIQDNNAGVIRTLFYAAAPLNAGVADQGDFTILSENGGQIIFRIQNTAAIGGTQILGYNRASGITLTLSGASTSTFAGGGVTVSGGAVLNTHATAGLGFGTGAGGTVAQATSKSTAVTLNKSTGQITMNSASLAAGTVVTFTLNSTAVAATDLIVVSHESGGTLGSYTVNGRATGAGTAAIDIRNNTAGALAEAIVLRYSVIKSVNA